jgi:hypothetical protein
MYGILKGTVALTYFTKLKTQKELSFSLSIPGGCVA